MRPFSGNSLINEKRKIFYYRLSRVHRIIEHTFGILVARWRIFQRPIEGTPDQVEKYVLATIALHNYLRQTDNACYTIIRSVRNARYASTAFETREKLTAYFVSERDTVSWQWDYIRTGTN